MHLGRFHYVVDHLEAHFRLAKLTDALENAAVSLDQFNQTRSESHISDFRTKLASALEAADNVAAELMQPYAQQVIEELGLRFLFPPNIRKAIEAVVAQNSFDSAALAAALRKQTKLYLTKITYVKQLDTSLRGLSAEYTEVEPDRAEFGLMLPRESVGERLPDLAKEFDKLSHLARAVNELTGETDYDSRVVTISSSWWQIFLDIPVEQVALWTFAIERIVTLFKNNLEIKKLQQQLGDREIPENILKEITKVVEKKISSELKLIAQDLVRRFGKIEDKGRLNEVETQIRQGLHYLARRMNQGAQIEINVGVPEEPDDPAVTDGEQPDAAVLEANQQLRQRIAHLRALRTSAMTASETSLQIEKDAPLLLEDPKQSSD